ncbi:MAG: GTP-binding protein [Candidatus Dojkabacteria bacterium]|nr:MAG: GTP-binding protein [Candidatus Dojkabacteria bacterium]
MAEITPNDKIRNIAIIAHVDHGKTTLIDAFLKQSNTFRENQEEMQQEQILDFNELERERGITIQAKNIALPYKGHLINIIDTPGHADFGGEVERTLSMADGAVLLVDAQEGVMPQTRFVLKRALELGLKIIVLVNKIDKKLADPASTVKKVQDLFLSLVTDMNQLEFPVYYAIGRDGKVFKELPVERGDDLANVPGDTTPLLDEVLAYIPAPSGDINEPFQMQVSSLDYDPHNGRYLIGRISHGKVSLGDSIKAAHPELPGKVISSKVKMLSVRKGLEYAQVDKAGVGDIVAIAGLDDVRIGSTLYVQEGTEIMPDIKISPPSLKMKFEANTSPFLGKEGKFPNLKQLQARLEHEKMINISLKIDKNDDGSYYVSGRGELHLGILVETLRREGYEFQLRKPEVIITVVDGKKMEPEEELYVEVPEEYFSVVSQIVNTRKGNLINVENANGQSKMTFHILARNLIGLRRQLATATKGNLVISNTFHQLVALGGGTIEERNGRLISNATGTSLAYALNSIQERGELLITPATEVYEGMVIGISKYENDISVNPMKAREKSNVRQSTATVTDVALKTPIQVTLEYAIGILADDEILEVTPLNLRIRKKFLNKTEEYMATKKKGKGGVAASEVEE